MIGRITTQRVNAPQSSQAQPSTESVFFSLQPPQKLTTRAKQKRCIRKTNITRTPRACQQQLMDYGRTAASIHKKSKGTRHRPLSEKAKIIGKYPHFHCRCSAKHSLRNRQSTHRSPLKLNHRSNTRHSPSELQESTTCRLQKSKA